MVKSAYIIIGINAITLVFIIVFFFLIKRNIKKERSEKSDKLLIPAESEMQKALVCPRCENQDITLISESKKKWWCNLCNFFFLDLT